MKNYIKEKKNELAGAQECKNFKEDMKRIYKSKISNIPTPGYTGYQSTYTNPIGYLNKDKIINEMDELENNNRLIQSLDNGTISGYYKKNRENEKEDLDEVQFFFNFFSI